MPNGRLIELAGMTPIGPRSARLELPNWAAAGDDNIDNFRSTLRLFEDGVELGPPHTRHDRLEVDPPGCFSHWRHGLYFTASDETNPASNGRRYTALVHTGPLSALFHVLMSGEPLYPRLVDTDEGYRMLELLARELEPGLRLSERKRSFLRDEEFRADFERFDAHNYRSYDRKFVMRELARYAVRLPGDMVECGVYRGATAWLMAKAIAESRNEERLLHLFDSFEGLSAPSAVDGDHWSAGDLAAPLEDVRRALAPFERHIRYWPGWIPSEFAHVRDRRFSLVHIDVDLAEPTWESLDFFFPRLVQHGIVVCDDYGFDTCPGARKAMDTYFAELDVPIVHLPTGQGMAIKTGAD